MKKIFFLIHRGKAKKGFISVVTLLSLPVGLSCLMVFTSLIFGIRNHDGAQRVCLQYTLQAQEQMKSSLTSLLRLNPIAKRLRKKQRQLELKLMQAVLTVNVVQAASLKVKIKIIKGKRIALDLQQKNILAQAKLRMEINFNSFRTHLRRFHPQRITKAHPQPFPLAVKARPRGSMAPTYHPVKNFSQLQAVVFSWQMPLYLNLPNWIKKMFFRSELSSYHCSATIKKRRGKWETTLIALK